MQTRVNENIIRGHEPESLGTAELQLDKVPLTKPPQPIPANAWVRYGGVPIWIDAIIVAWTDYAVAIKWKTPDGEHHAWVWASAVRGR
jgi:hypothetical protein